MMTSSKKIEIGQSSLLGLKAELERKRKEVVLGKSKNLSSKLKLKRHTRQNVRENPTEKTENKEEEAEAEAEAELLKKSRITLETKAKTYELLSGKQILGANQVDTDDFLVDFKKKQEEEEEEERGQQKDVVYDESDGEWIDYVDCLGRTRRCHRDDYKVVKEQDSILKNKLFGRSSPEFVNRESLSGFDSFSMRTPEEDPTKDAIRQKWEEQERILSEKKDVHYQDVLFNEARSHGVGYYEFSTDERDRRRQQEELKRTREETRKLQESARDAREKKRKQTEERLRAARKRKRERLGLPPEEEDIDRLVETESCIENIAESETSNPVRSPRNDEIIDSSKPVRVRPWDVGKDGVSGVLSQDEWIKKKRTERIAEFAPPSSDFRKTRRPKPDAEPPEDRLAKGARIPPPRSYGRVQDVSPDLEKSIEEGLLFLREQTERKLQGKTGS